MGENPKALAHAIAQALSAVGEGEWNVVRQFQTWGVVGDDGSAFSVEGDLTDRALATLAREYLRLKAMAPQPKRIGFILNHDQVDELRAGQRLYLSHDGVEVELRGPCSARFEAAIGDACDPAQPPEHERIVVHDPNRPREMREVGPSFFTALGAGSICQIDPMSGDPVAPDHPIPSYRDMVEAHTRRINEALAMPHHDLIFGGAVTSTIVEKPEPLTVEKVEEMIRTFRHPRGELLRIRPGNHGKVEPRPAYDGPIEPGMIFHHTGSIPQRFALVTKIRGDQVHWVDCDAEWPETSQTERYFRRDVPMGPGPYMASAEALAMVEKEKPDITWDRGIQLKGGGYRMSFNPTNSEEPKYAHAIATDLDTGETTILALDEQSPPSLRTKEPGVVPDGIDWPCHGLRMGKSIAEMGATERNRAYLKLRQAQSAPNYGPCARLLAWVEEHVGPVGEVVGELKAA